jgi:hypothetical protein
MTPLPGGVSWLKKKAPDKSAPGSKNYEKNNDGDGPRTTTNNLRNRV